MSSNRGVPDRGRIRVGVGFTLEVLRARGLSRRFLSILSLLLGLVGAGVAAYPVLTNLYQDRLQTHLAVQLESPGLERAYATGRVDEGNSLTRLVIPAIDVDVVVVEGTSPSALRSGAGHYPDTALPGEEGNVAIAGHRTTYGRPFANLDRLRPDDRLILETPLGRHVYRVSGPPQAVASTDWSPIAQTSGRTLTLTTCHPKGSARQRLYVRAELDSETIGG